MLLCAAEPPLLVPPPPVIASISTTLGLVLLVALIVDLFRTAFHAEGRGGPINQRQNRLLWRLVRSAGTRNGRVRPAVLSLGGPVMAVATIAGWALLLVAGFWLIYLPHVAGFHFSPGQSHGSALEAFYYSGMVASTLGLGDVVPRPGPLRVLTVLQAMSGFALLTVAVTYVLAVYRELVDAQSLATSIDAYLTVLDGSAGGADVAWERALAGNLCHALESHHNYPILRFFRPERARSALPLQVARLRRRIPAGDGAPISRRLLLSVIERYVEEVHELYVEGQETEPGNVEEGEGPSRLDQMLRMLAYDPPEGAPGAE